MKEKDVKYQFMISNADRSDKDGTRLRSKERNFLICQFRDERFKNLYNARR